MKRLAALGDDHHPEGARLTSKTRPVVVCPKRRRWQIGVKLPGDLRLGERISVDATSCGNDDPGAWQRYRFEVLGELARRRGVRVGDSHPPRHSQRATDTYPILKEATSRNGLHVISSLGIRAGETHRLRNLPDWFNA